MEAVKTQTIKHQQGAFHMKTKSILMAAAAAVLMSTSAMANSPEVRSPSPVYVPGADITVYTDSSGAISKHEWLAFQSQKFDQMAAANAEDKVYNDQGRVISKDEWLASQSKKFDDM